MQGVLVPKVIDELPPDRTIIAIDWSDFFFDGTSCDRTVFERLGVSFELWDCELILQGISEDRKRINFTISGFGEDVGYVLIIGTEPEGYSIALQPGCNDITVKYGQSVYRGIEFFQKNPPIFWLDNIGCLTEGCIYVSGYEPEIGTFTADELIAWDWKDVKINRESQGPDKVNDTIQYFVCQNIHRDECELLFDDDDRGEAADIVAFYNKDDAINVIFYHLKYSKGNPGRRIDDLYQVCGQTQKSIRWAGYTQRLLDHLRDRENRRQQLHPGKSRIEYGGIESFSKLRAYLKAKRIKYHMVIVQPGLSKSTLYDGSDEALAILRLFGATRMYLEETYDIDLKVICSE
jgi:hypothetical protein